MDKYLINREDLKRVRPTAELDEARVQPYIKEAQQYDLRPFLNDALYYDFITKFEDQGDPMYEDYKKLLNGTVYTYNGAPIYFPGIAYMLAYFTLARFVIGDPVHYTRFGIMHKLNEFSTPLSPDEIYAESKMLKSNGVAEQTNVKSFLDNNRTIYTLWGFSGVAHSVQKSALNIGKI